MQKNKENKLLIPITSFTLEEVRQIVKDHPKIVSDIFQKRYIDSCPELKEAQVKYDLSPKGIKWHLSKDVPFCEHICKVCGKPVKFYNSERGYNTYCSMHCRNSDPDYFDKQKENSLKKYGCISYFQTEEFKNKAKQTNLRKYGVENAACNEQIKQKAIETNLKKYGYTSTALVPEIKSKRLKTTLERYGTLNVSQLDSIKEKTKQTNLKKYNSEYFCNSEEGKSKIQIALINKYGTKCSLKDPKVKEKADKTLREKYGYTLSDGLLNSKELKLKMQKSINNATYEKVINLAKENDIVLLTSKDEFKGTGYSNSYSWKCLKCGEEYQHYYANGIIPKCPKCNPYAPSQMQIELVNYIKSIYNDTNIQTNTRSIISPLELDIYLPKLKLAIEFNGDYWHSSEQKEKDYHLNKTKLCEEKGIKLIHIWEHDWLTKEDKIKQRLNYLINGKTSLNKVYARNCIVKEVDNELTKKFLNTYHLQGSINSKVNLGLYYQDELIAVMTFGKPRFNKNYQWELLRFANNPAYRTIGGASKLLKYFEREYKPNSLISYADRCWSNGNLYLQLGFNLIDASKPNYIWVKKDSIYTRYQTQKHKLKNILKDKFDPNKSESENMINNGYLKIYDCGNAVFVKEYQ